MSNALGIKLWVMREDFYEIFIFFDDNLIKKSFEWQKSSAEITFVEKSVTRSKLKKLHNSKVNFKHEKVT